MLQGKAADSDLAWYVQPEQLRGLKKTLHDADQPIENPGVAVLLGGILSAIDNQGLLSGAVALQNDALELSAVASVENSGAASPLVSVFFGDKHQLVALGWRPVHWKRSCSYRPFVT